MKPLSLSIVYSSETEKKIKTDTLTPPLIGGNISIIYKKYKLKYHL